MCDAAPRRPASLVPAASTTTGFLLAGRTGGRHEGPAVGDVLHVDGDRPAALVLGEMLEQVGQRHVGLVADRGEAAESQAHPPEQESDLEREVARLRDQPDRACGILVGRDPQIGVGVEDPDAVRAEHQRAGSPHPIAQRELALAARGVALAEARGHHDERARTDLERGLDRVLERSFGHRHDDEVGLARELAQRGAQRPAEELAATRVDQVHGRRSPPSSAACASQ